MILDSKASLKRSGIQKKSESKIYSINYEYLLPCLCFISRFNLAGVEYISGLIFCPVGSIFFGGLAEIDKYCDAIN